MPYHLLKALADLGIGAFILTGKRNRGGDVFGFTWCAAQRASAYRPIEYCFGKEENRLNPWGCKQARADWTEWSDWFCFGNWEKSGLLGKKVQWRFDKERIHHELATSLYRFRHCPHLKTKFIEAALKHLPEIVFPGFRLELELSFFK